MSTMTAPPDVVPVTKTKSQKTFRLFMKMVARKKDLSKRQAGFKDFFEYFMLHGSKTKMYVGPDYMGHLRKDDELAIWIRKDKFKGKHRLIRMDMKEVIELLGDEYFAATEVYPTFPKFP